MKKIICIGSSAKDIFFPTSEGVIMETPEDLMAQRKIAFELGAKYQVDEIFEAPGGTATNVAQGLARLGVDVSVYTKIGGNSTGEWIKDELEKETVGTELLQVDVNAKSDLSAIVVNKETKEHVIFFNRDSNDKLEISSGGIRGSEWFFLSALNGEWEEKFDIILKVSKEDDVKIAFNPGQKNIHDNPEKINEIIKMSNVLILNKDEAIEIVSSLGDPEGDINDELFLVKKLRGMGAEVVAVTDGKRGAWAYGGGDIFYSRSSEREAVDTLGAGDSFTSGFLSGFLSGSEIDECLRWGMANGVSVVKFYGAKEGLLRSQQMKDASVKITIEKISGDL